MKISEALRAAIEKWLSLSKHNNYNVLSDKAQLNYSTVYRLANGQIEKPQIDSVLSLLRIVLSRNERIVFLKTFYPDIAQDFEVEDHFIDRKVAETNVTRPDIDKLFEHPDGFYLGQFLLSDCGVDTTQIERLTGKRGMDLVKRLEDEGTVEFKDGKWRIPVYFSSTTLRSNLLQIRHSVDCFKPESAEVRAGYVRTISNGVTLSAAQTIRKKLDECAVEIDRIASENPGNHIFLSNLMTQLLDPEKAIEEQNSSQQVENDK